MKNTIIFLFGAAAVFSVFMLTAYTDNDNKPTQTNTANNQGNNNEEGAPQTLNSPVQEIRAPKLPTEMSFADETVSLEDFDILERIDREVLSTCFRHSNIIGVLKRANRIFPIIEPILAKNGVPDDIKYLAVTESELMELVSPAGAAGVWQFMKTTAPGYGLEVGDEVDERYHLEKATEAACKLLKKNKERFGSWMLAAAAYNMGEAGLARDMSAQQMTKYFDLHLNRETSRYVPRILATKEVMQNPQKYGILLENDDLHPQMPQFNIVKVTGAVANWGEFAKQQGISYRTLCLYNGWIRSSKLTNKYAKTYEVKIPIK